MNEPRFCSECGAVNKPGDKFCPSCGRELLRSPTEAKSSLRPLRLAIAAVATALLAGVVAFVALDDDEVVADTAADVPTSEEDDEADRDESVGDAGDGIGQLPETVIYEGTETSPRNAVARFYLSTIGEAECMLEVLFDGYGFTPVDAYNALMNGMPADAVDEAMSACLSGTGTPEPERTADDLAYESCWAYNEMMDRGSAGLVTERYWRDRIGTIADTMAEAARMDDAFAGIADSLARAASYYQQGDGSRLISSDDFSNQGSAIRIYANQCTRILQALN